MDTRKSEEMDNPRKEFKLTKEEQYAKLYFDEINPHTHYFYVDDSKDNKSLDQKIEKLRPVSILSIKNRSPERLKYLESFFAKQLKEIYNTLWLTFSFDKINFYHFQNYILPCILAGVAYGTEEFFSTQFGRIITGSDDYDFILKLALSGYILNHSRKFRTTDQKIISTHEFALKAASEVFAIFNLYSGSYAGFKKILDFFLPNSYALLTSLVASSLIIPSTISYHVQKYEKQIFEKEYLEGGQRSVTALISSGLTPFSNTFFNAYALLMKEFSFAKGFQLGLIANNIISDIGISKQLRNLPSMLIDVIPQVLRKLFVQLKKIEDDYKKNTTMIFTLNLNYIPPRLEDKKIHELRKGDLVWCGKNIDFSSVPISGEIYAFERCANGDFRADSKEPREVRVNLKTYTGENTWIKNFTHEFDVNDYKEIDQRAIQEHKQLGILNGAEIDFLGSHQNFFIRVGRKKEYVQDTSYEKKSVTNEIINQYKKNNIIFALAGSLGLAVFMNNTPTGIFLHSIKLLFSVFQMMIPFSESFLREMVNSKIMKKINYVIPDMPLDMLDALRITDFWHALSGYYRDQFPKGVIIISDKTGTLTTTRMKAFGFWTLDMPSDDLTLKKDPYNNPIHVIPRDINKLLLSFELFAGSFTHSKKEFEPEEHSILSMFKQLLRDNQCLKIETISNHHFKKTLSVGKLSKEVETIHLGLFTQFGGRFTLETDDQKKYLIFCGIPRVDKFKESNLFKHYNTMKRRLGVLSRDWCVSRTEIPDDFYAVLLSAFKRDDHPEIESLLDSDIVRKLEFCCTFLVNNPVKKGAEHFISRSKTVNIPVLVATGDTAKASENIARVLCPDQITNIVIIRAAEAHDSIVPYDNLSKSTVIFAGINEHILKQFDRLMTIDIKERPNIIFAEMTTVDKGTLATHVKKEGFFVVANGDGTNDTHMMKVADLVIAHLSSEGTYAPGVSQYANINDRQIQKLCHKFSSFYDLFDIDKRENSQCILPFIRLANAQEMVSYALNFKATKMSMEFALALGANDVFEIYQQQWWSVFVDLSWFGISAACILENADLPVDEKHLGKSWLPTKCMALTVALAAFESFVCYQFLGKTTDVTLLLAKLALLPIFLKSFFSGYRMVQHELKPLNKDEQQIMQVKKHEKVVRHYPPLQNSIKAFPFLNKKREIKSDEKSEKRRCCVIL